MDLETEIIQADLDALLSWTQKNKLPFNMDKCAHIALGKSQKSLRFGNEIIKSASVQSDLGLIFSNDLKWNFHIEKACQKQTDYFT